MITKTARSKLGSETKKMTTKKNKAVKKKKTKLSCRSLEDFCSSAVVVPVNDDPFKIKLIWVYLLK